MLYVLHNPNIPNITPNMCIKGNVFIYSLLKIYIDLLKNKKKCKYIVEALQIEKTQTTYSLILLKNLSQGKRTNITI